jgi:type VI secretion system secreted protein Hcp
MAYDAFLKIDGIKGESQDSKHKGEIDIMSYSFGVNQVGTHAMGSGGGSGKASFQDLHIVKRTDSASPLLFLNCANGAHIKEANLTVRKAGGDQMEYLKIKLSDVLVSSYHPVGNSSITGNLRESAAAAGGAGGFTGNTLNAEQESPIEEVSLNFAKIEFSYQPQGADGRPQGGPVLAGWDLKQNKKV